MQLPLIVSQVMPPRKRKRYDTSKCRRCEGTVYFKTGRQPPTLCRPCRKEIAKEQRMTCECGGRKADESHLCCERCAKIDGIGLHSHHKLSGAGIIVSVLSALGGCATKDAIIEEMGGFNQNTDRRFYRAMAALKKAGRVKTVPVAEDMQWQLGVHSNRAFEYVPHERDTKHTRLGYYRLRKRPKTTGWGGEQVLYMLVGV